MTQKSNSDDTLTANGRPVFPLEVMQILWPALQVGAFSGFSGLLVGGFGGLARSNHPALFAMVSSFQWFTLGTTFWATRGAVLRYSWDEDNATPNHKIIASSIAGYAGGGFGGLLRGRASVIPGAVMFGLFGAGGQKFYNMVDSRHSQEVESTEIQQPKKSWMDSKWSPVKILTDEEYEKMLQDKLLDVNAEIAIMDENIEALRSQKTDTKRRASITNKEANGKSNIN